MNEVTWDAVMDKIRDAMNRETPVDVKDAGSDGHERYQCPVCGSWWFFNTYHYCPNCGQKIRYR